MDNLETVGTSAGSGIFGATLAYLVSYFKNKEVKDANKEIRLSIDERVTKEVCDIKREYITKVSNDLSDNLKRLELKIDILIDHSLQHRKGDRYNETTT